MVSNDSPMPDNSPEARARRLQPPVRVQTADGKVRVNLFAGPVSKPSDGSIPFSRR